MFTSELWWFSPLYRRCITEYQHSGQYPQEYLGVSVREYEYKYKYFYFGTPDYEKERGSEIQYSSTASTSTKYEYQWKMRFPLCQTYKLTMA